MPVRRLYLQLVNSLIVSAYAHIASHGHEATTNCVPEGDVNLMNMWSDRDRTDFCATDLLL